MKLKKLIIRVIKMLILALILASVGVVLLQDFLIFPMLWTSYRPVMPDGVSSEVREMQDGNYLEIWSMDASPHGAFFSDRAVAILFCGNGGGLNGHYYSQSLFASWGIKSYLVDFPGYGNSTGWPSEELLYRDAIEVGNYVIQKEGIDASRLIVGGTSLGTGLAAYLAKEMQPRALVLFAGYADMAQVVRDRNFLYKLLSPFLKYRFPTTQYVSKLTSTSVIAAHGTADQVIPYKHLEQIIGAYKGQGKNVEILVPGATHNAIVSLSKEKVYSGLMSIWAKPQIVPVQ